MNELTDEEAARVLHDVFYEDAVAGYRYWETAVDGLRARGYRLVAIDSDSPIPSTDSETR